MRRLSLWSLLCCVVLSGLSCSPETVPPPVSSAPPVSGENSDTPSEKITVNLETTKGLIVMELYPDWAPIGVKRVQDLVKNGFYNDVAFFRVVPGFVVQFGMNGDPATNANWADSNLQDDPVKQSNRRGYVTFAKTGAPNSRSTQLFISLNDNASLDEQGFAPIGRIVEGMDIVAKLNAEYGEQPQQQLITAKGNAYLKPNFPNLDYIVKATIVEPGKGTAQNQDPTEPGERASDSEKSANTEKPASDEK